VRGEEGVAHMLVTLDTHVVSLEGIGLLTEGKVRNLDVAEPGCWSIGTNSCSNAEQEIFLHPHEHVVGGRK